MQTWLTDQPFFPAPQLNEQWVDGFRQQPFVTMHPLMLLYVGQWLIKILPAWRQLFGDIVKMHFPTGSLPDQSLNANFEKIA